MKKDEIELGAFVKKGMTGPFKDKGVGVIRDSKHEANHYYCLIRWKDSEVEEWVHTNRLIRL